MVGLSFVMLGLAAVLAVLGVFAMWRCLCARTDNDRATEGLMLGVEFGAFNLPQAELPDHIAHRRARQWSVCALVALTSSLGVGAIGFAL